MARRTRRRRVDAYEPDVDEQPEPDDAAVDDGTSTVTIEQYRKGERPA